MWPIRLKQMPRQHKSAMGGAIAAATLAAVCLIGAMPSPRSLQVVQAPAADTDREATAKVAISLPPAAATHAFQPLTPAQVATIQAKFAVLNSPRFVEDSADEPARPPVAPTVASVEAPLAPTAAAPQPMEVAMQMSEAPAAAALVQAPPASASELGRVAASDQHLPMPSRW
jgi:hypothetical protein